MRHLMSLAVLASFVFLPVRGADEKKSRDDRLKELQQDIQTKLAEVVKDYRSAQTDADREKALAKMDPLVKQGLKLVAEDPGDDISFNALNLLMRCKPTPPDKVIDLLIEHHLDHPKLTQVFARVGRNPAGEKLLRTALAKSTNKEVKGNACLTLGQQLAEQADGAEGEAAVKLGQEAETYLARVSKEFGDVRGGALAKSAEKLLFAVRHLAVGRKAPEVISKDLQDKEAKLSALKGKVVVLDIWATWCGPCRAMIPHEREMVEKFKDKPFALVSISADDKKETLTKFLEKEKMPWTHWWEGRKDNGIIVDWNVTFFPTIYVLDATGVIRYKNVRGKELEDAVEKLLKEANTKS